MSKHNYKVHPSRSLDANSLSHPPKSIHEPVTISFVHVSPGDRHCLSFCDRKELKGVSDCLRKLTTLTWAQVVQQSGKPGNKTGLAWTPYSDGDLRTVTRPQGLSKEIAIGSLRSGDKARVYGGHKDHVFYVLWFDRNHEIYPV